MRLPAEIRNNIWQLVLGGRSIEVRDYGRCSTCCAAHEDLDRALNIKAGNRQQIMQDHPLHVDCFVLHKPAKIGLTLSLLLACRQIHQEAALLPFATNNFVFQSYSALRIFLRRLVTGQARQIASISILLDMITSLRKKRLNLSSHDPLRTLIQSKLTGLRQIVFVGIDYTSTFAISGRSDIGDEMVGLFRDLSIERAVVVVAFSDLTYRLMGTQKVQHKAGWGPLTAWEDNVERKLLGGVEEIEDDGR